MNWFRRQIGIFKIGIIIILILGCIVLLRVGNIEKIDTEDSVVPKEVDVKENSNSITEKGLLKNQVINISGIDRNYHLFIPNNPINAPIVMLFHGNGGSFDDMIGLANGGKSPHQLWLDIAERENLILIVPNGIMGPENTRGWNDCRTDSARTPISDDVLLTNNLLDFVINTYKANSSKVYAVGTSNGGHFSIRLAQEIPNRITAFAAIVASNTKNSKCVNSTDKVSALFMNGTEDPFVSYNGGKGSNNTGEGFSIEETINYWVIRNQTTQTPIITNFPDINKKDKSTAEKYIYRNGGNNTEVALYKIIGGGHIEPSIAERYGFLYLKLVGNQNADIEMANEVWDFLKNKSK
jgi:polyhydroxybutyrate depolymerase